MKNLIAAILLCLTINAFTQEKTQDLTKVFRVNFLNPGVEIEIPLAEKSTFAANAGVGFEGSYRNLNYTNSGFTYFIAPFLDVSYKHIYNREKRAFKDRNLAYNAGNYWGARLLTHFKELKAHNIYRKDDTSFAFGPTWGIQRSYGKVHFLFDLGPIYYFDTKGNSGIFPIMLQLNVGLNVKKW